MEITKKEMARSSREEPQKLLQKLLPTKGGRSFLNRQASANKRNPSTN
jgi:hypothetical protein